jgi:hypothetical protein
MKSRPRPLIVTRTMTSESVNCVGSITEPTPLGKLTSARSGGAIATCSSVTVSWS